MLFGGMDGDAERRGRRDASVRGEPPTSLELRRERGSKLSLIYVGAFRNELETAAFVIAQE